MNQKKHQHYSFLIINYSLLLSMGRWQSGQLHQTVNLTPHGYVGSNPTLPRFIINVTIMVNWFVYVLSMNKWKYYIWSTTDLERRIIQHQNWYVKSTKLFIPIWLLYSRTYDTIKEARQKEYLLKKQKNRKQIEKFMQWF